MKESVSWQVSWLSVHRASAAFPVIRTSGSVAKRSPITVAGAAPAFRFNVCEPGTGFPF